MSISIYQLIDPIFYSKEGLSAATTPSYLHATAVNHAVAYGLGRESINPILFLENGRRNIPRYESSQICPDFYFTPARIEEYHISTTNCKRRRRWFS